MLARFSHWRSLAWLDAGRAAVAVAVPVLWSPDATGFAVTLALVLMLGTLSALFDPNLGTLIPQLVAADEVAQASCLFDLTSRVAGVVGQGSVGALLLLVPEVQLFAVDGFTFAVSAAALSWLGRCGTTSGPGRARVRKPRARPQKAAGPARSARPAGQERSVRRPAAVRARRLLREHRAVGVAIAVHAVAMFASAVSTVGLPPLLVSRFGQGAAGYGLALAATAAGGLAGNLLTGHLPVHPSWLSGYCLAWAAAGLALAGLGLADSMPAVIVLCVVSGLLFPVCAVTLRALDVYKRQPDVDQTAVRTASVAGTLLLPFAVDAAPAAAFVGAGLLLAATALAGRCLDGRQGARP